MAVCFHTRHWGKKTCSLELILLINNNSYAQKDNKYKQRKQLKCQLDHKMLLKNKQLLLHVCLTTPSTKTRYALTIEKSILISTWTKYKCCRFLNKEHDVTKHVYIFLNTLCQK